jgi:hypothetical protein
MEAVGSAVALALAERLGPGHEVTLVESEAEAGPVRCPPPPPVGPLYPPDRQRRDRRPLRAARPAVVGRIADGASADSRRVEPDTLRVELD